MKTLIALFLALLGLSSEAQTLYWGAHTNGLGAGISGGADNTVSGNGAGLTNLNQAQVTFALTNGNPALTLNNINNVLAGSLYGVAGVVFDGGSSFFGNFTATNGYQFTGNGAGLTNVPATGIATNAPQPGASLVTDGTNAFWGNSFPLWQSNTAYLAGNYVATTNGDLYEAWQAGTTTTVVPTGRQAVTNGVVWYYVGRTYTRTFPGLSQDDIPLAVYTGSTNIPIFTNATYYQACSQNGSLGYPPNTNWFRFGGGDIVTGAGPYFRVTYTISSPLGYAAAGNPANLFTNNNIDTFWAGSNPNYSWVDDAIAYAIGPHNAFGHSGTIGIIAVNDIVVWQQSLDGSSGQSINVLFGSWKPRKLTVWYNYSSSGFPGIAVDKNASVPVPPPVAFNVGIEECSYGHGGNNEPSLSGMLWPEIFQRYLRGANVVCGGVGGTGFCNSNSMTLYTYPGSNAVGNTYNQRLTNWIGKNEDVHIVNPASNDSGSTSNAEWAAVTNYLIIYRLQHPSTPIEVMHFVPAYILATNLGILTNVLAVSNAVVTVGDTNTWWHNFTQLFTGNGCQATNTGIGSCDRLIGNDGPSGHPDDAGATAIARAALNAMQQDFGTPAQAWRPFYTALMNPINLQQ